MTPQKTKRPLPSLPATSARCPPEHPASFSEWQIALQGLKLLYLKRQYKQCASRCTQLLEEAKPLLHPAHRTFLLFYCALSNELTARSLHNLSTTKLPLLELAKEYYHSAACYLPTPEPTDDPSDTQDYPHSEVDSPNEDEESPNEDEDVPQDTYSTSSSTPSSPTTPIYPHDPLRRSSFSSIESASIEDNDNSNSNASSIADWSSYQDSILLPSPLRIRKAVHFNPETTLSPPPNSIITLSPTSQPQPHSLSPTSIISPPTYLLPHSPTAYLLSTNLCLTTSPSIQFTTQTTHWLRTRAQSRYNTHLATLHPLLTSHITTINNLITLTKEAQLSTRKVSSGDEEEDIKSQKARRIERLKARNWKRERFDKTRIEDLCQRALEEL
ncbi:MAG: hypothetical protein M1812_003148 [Candelaria pacifica]|nr:MAG: hypothetical protein M1812_003148 [Candelaria pacifica]